MQELTGHYVGSVTIAGVAYFGNAVVTQDGAIRLYIGGSYAASVGGQFIETVRPERLLAGSGGSQLNCPRSIGYDSAIGSGVSARGDGHRHRSIVPSRTRSSLRDRADLTVLAN